MKISALIASVLIIFAVSCTSSTTTSDFGLKPRIVVLTDIAPGDIEPDDMESMIRLMAHADLFEIVALITSGGWNSGGRAYPIGWKDSLSRTIGAYEKDLPNLMKRSDQTGFMSLEDELATQEIGYWPSADYMRSRAMLGRLELGRHKIGADNRSMKRMTGRYGSLHGAEPIHLHRQYGRCNRSVRLSRSRNSYASSESTPLQIRMFRGENVIAIIRSAHIMKCDATSLKTLCSSGTRAHGFHRTQ